METDGTQINARGMRFVRSISISSPTYKEYAVATVMKLRDKNLICVHLWLVFVFPSPDVDFEIEFDADALEDLVADQFD